MEVLPFLVVVEKGSCAAYPPASEDGRLDVAESEAIRAIVVDFPVAK